jgi:hypothetical protein
MIKKKKTITKVKKTIKPKIIRKRIIKPILRKKFKASNEDGVTLPQVAPSSPPPEVEVLSKKKFLNGFFNIKSPVLWLKDLCGLINLRKIIVAILVIGCFYGWGYVRGIKNKPVFFNLEGKEATIALNNHRLHILPDGSAQVEDKDGTVLKKITVKDIPELRKALNPISFQFKPFALAGYGIAQGTSGMEYGAGVSWFKIWRANIDSMLTQVAVYPLGISYKLDQLHLPNSAVGLAGGIGYDGDKRALLYFKMNF